MFFSKHKNDALVTALLKNDLELIGAALKKIRNVNFEITHEINDYFASHTPLSMMVTTGSLSCVQMLLAHGANPNHVIFTDPLWSEQSGPDLLPSSVLYLAVSNCTSPNMQQMYNLLRQYNADMFCNKNQQPDFGFMNSSDDVAFSVQTKLEQRNILRKWKQWEEEYQALRMNTMLHNTISETTVPVRKSKI